LALEFLGISPSKIGMNHENHVKSDQIHRVFGDQIHQVGIFNHQKKGFHQAICWGI
jgi:hypothetical protein